MFKEKSIHYFNNGYSCSESLIQAAYECAITSQNLLPVASAFSGGMSSGCLCGAAAACQIILGFRYGRENAFGEQENIRALAKEFLERFKSKHHATCCKVLSAKFEFHSPERKKHCTKFVADCCDILTEMIVEIDAKKAKA